LVDQPSNEPDGTTDSDTDLSHGARSILHAVTISATSPDLSHLRNRSLLRALTDSDIDQVLLQLSPPVPSSPQAANQGAVVPVSLLCTQPTSEGVESDLVMLAVQKMMPGRIPKEPDKNVLQESVLETIVGSLKECSQIYQDSIGSNPNKNGALTNSAKAANLTGLVLKGRRIAQAIKSPTVLNKQLVSDKIVSEELLGCRDGENWRGMILTTRGKLKQYFLHMKLKLSVQEQEFESNTEPHHNIKHKPPHLASYKGHNRQIGITRPLNVLLINCNCANLSIQRIKLENTITMNFAPSQITSTVNNGKITLLKIYEELFVTPIDHSKEETIMLFTGDLAVYIKRGDKRLTFIKKIRRVGVYINTVNDEAMRSDVELRVAWLLVLGKLEKTQKVRLNNSVQLNKAIEVLKSLGKVLNPLEVINGISLANIHKMLEEGDLDPNELAIAEVG
jgi:hypothetical protein